MPDFVTAFLSNVGREQTQRLDDIPNVTQVHAALATTTLFSGLPVAFFS
jgi:hypothetical protein